MRIIAGKHRGRSLETLKSKGTKSPKAKPSIRPTSSMAREAIFNIVSHSRIAADDGPPLTGLRVADVCCGSGALGLEALSRGAENVTFVDSSRESLKIVRNNTARFGEMEHAQFLHTPATQLPVLKTPFHLIFLDPPYEGGLLPGILIALLKAGWVDDETLIVIEHDTKLPPLIPEPFQSIDQRKYGRATIQLLELLPENAS